MARSNSSNLPPPSPSSDIFEDADEDDVPVPFSPVGAGSAVASSPHAVVDPPTPSSPMAHFASTASPSLSLPSKTAPHQHPAKPTPLVTTPVPPQQDIPELPLKDESVVPAVISPPVMVGHEDEDHVPLAVVRERHSAQNSPATPTTPMSFARTVLQSPLRVSSSDFKPLPKPDDPEGADESLEAPAVSSTVSKEKFDAEMPPLSVQSIMPASWPEFKTPAPAAGNYESQSESEGDYDSSDTSSDLGTIPRKTPRETSVGMGSRSYSTSSSFSRQLSSEDLRASGVGTRTVKPKTSGWLGSIYNAFQSFIDPELTDDQLLTNGSPSNGLKRSDSMPTVPTPDEDFMEGKKMFDGKQYSKAVKLFELAVAACNHVEAMKYLAECYVPSRLSNSSKVSDWTKRRMAVLNTPEGMLQHASFLRKTNFNKYEGEPIVLIRAAADAGHPPAMHEFGLYLRDIGKGTEAMAWFHKAAEMDYEDSEEPIAEGYEQGIGVPADPVAGAAWRERVNERKQEEAEKRRRREMKEEALAVRVRAEAARRAEEKARKEREARIREADAAARRALDKPLSAAIRNIEWGFYSKGIDQLHELATQGNADARDFLDPDLSSMSFKNSQGMYFMGQHHAAHADPIAAAKWYRRSAEAGYHEAMVTYAAYLIVGKGMDTSDPGQAMAWLMKSWDVGRNREAALALGEAYTKGIGVMPDPVKAVKWYTRAWEEGGYSEAAFAVGLAYATGFTPGAVDPTQWSHASFGGNPKVSEHLDARTIVKKSDLAAQAASDETTVTTSPTSNGDDDDTVPSVPHPQTPTVPSPRPMSRSSTHGPGTPKEGQSPVSGNSPAASPVFGPKRVLRNMTAVKQDVVMAGIWYRRAADKGHSRASNNLGELYMTGRGVPRDDMVGFALFRRAAMAGLSEAEYNLGRCYREGRGCAPNEDMAISWFLKAEEKGIPEATKALLVTPQGRRASKKIPPGQQ
ncbi:hypothetical protein HDU67_006649 [Dinochytrium kinnereticum]|nr:hypothetical protein HDU67_006649 [Dinochytrium kinnereticum]